MRILVTGASGFIGQILLRKLGSDHHITALGRSAGAAGAAENVELKPCDLNDPAAVRSALAELEQTDPFDVIIHIAVSRLHRDFPATALDLFHVNTAATAYLMDFAWRTGVSHAIIGSTGSVYNPPAGVLSSERDFTPPKSFFAASKQAADAFAEQYRALLPVSILRLFVPYGPGQTDRMLPGLVNRLRNGQPVTVPVTGPALTFAPIYGEDVVRVIETCMAEVWNETVNVATSEVLTLDQAARVIGEALGIEAKIESSETAGSHYLVPDVSRLNALMDTSGFTTFTDGIHAMVQAHGQG